MAWAILGSMTDRPGQAPTSPLRATEPEPGLEPSIAVPDDASLERVRALCPHLISSDGDWRALAPAREHVCAAVDPPTPIAPDKQRRLCLVAAHVECATYLAARSALIEDAQGGRADERDARQGSDGGGAGEAMTSGAARGALWPMPRTGPVVVDRGRPGLASLRLDRSMAQVGLVALMVLAFLVLAVARFTSHDDGSDAVASPLPSAAASAVAPTAAPSPSPPPTAAPSAAASPSPSASPAASTASSTRTYRVRSGDTLSAIAARFGTTIAVLRELNDITDPSLLRVGQVLRLP